MEVSDWKVLYIYIYLPIALTIGSFLQYYYLFHKLLYLRKESGQSHFPILTSLSKLVRKEKISDSIFSYVPVALLLLGLAVTVC